MKFVEELQVTERKRIEAAKKEKSEEEKRKQKKERGKSPTGGTGSTRRTEVDGG